ncbi:MAG: hypothetical protein GEU28_14425, partial [Dehalococcoidia bacterium]|nr:hypothetical protein [Dehalococcoidia bacterium]
MAIQAAERELRERAARGDGDAFTELARHALPYLYDFASRLLRETDEAKTVVGEAFLALAQKQADLATGESFRALALAAVLEAGARRIRSRGALAAQQIHLGVHSDDIYYRSARSYARQEGFDEGIALLVWQVADALDRRQYALLDLFLRQGLTTAELAQVFSVSASSVSATIQRMEAAVESAMIAVVIAQRGRRWCRDLDMMLMNEDRARMVEATNRRVREHIDDCNACLQTTRRFGRCLDVYRTFVPLTPPPGLRSSLLGPALALFKHESGGAAPAADAQPRSPLVSPTGRIRAGTVALSSRMPLHPSRVEERAPVFRAARVPISSDDSPSDESYLYLYQPGARRDRRFLYLVLAGLGTVFL